jgi:hypothetical protein
MAGLNITIGTMRRRALVDVPDYYCKKYDISAKTILCHVLGIWQSVDADWSGPIAVCELDDGRVIEVVVDCIKFCDTDKDGVLLL